MVPPMCMHKNLPGKLWGNLPETCRKPGKPRGFPQMHVQKPARKIAGEPTGNPGRETWKPTYRKPAGFRAHNVMFRESYRKPAIAVHLRPDFEGNFRLIF